MKKLTIFLMGLVAFCSYPFLGHAIPANIGFFMMAGVLVTMAETNHYH